MQKYQSETAGQRANGLRISPTRSAAERAERVGLMRVLARRSVGHGYILKVEIYFFYQTTPESGNEIKKRLD